MNTNTTEDVGEETLSFVQQSADNVPEKIVDIVDEEADNDVKTADIEENGDDLVGKKADIAKEIADVEDKTADIVEKRVDLVEKNVSVEDADDDLDTRCGFDFFHPAWLQRLASKKTFVLLYGLVGGSQFAQGSYYIATISTVEKRFKMSSRTTGIVTSGQDVSSFFVCLLIAYLGSRGNVNKTRWVAFGTLLVGVSCFMNAVPHWLYGAGHDALELTRGNVTSQVKKAALCGLSAVEDDDCTEGDSSFMTAIIFFVSRLILGVGTSMYWTLGVTYLDDNVAKTKTPILLSVVSCIRMLGPTVGFTFASYSLGLYIDPSLTPSITSEDPRWIGAWWLGWMPAAGLMTVLALFLSLFPKTLPRAALRIAEAENRPVPSERSLADFKRTIERLVKNPIIVFNTLSIVCFIFGYIGYWTFMPKYMETQFRQSASQASLITGSIGLISTGIGLLFSGAVVTRFKPRARILAAWNVIVEVLEIFVRISYVFIGCPVQDLHGSWSSEEQNVWNLEQDCNSGCECPSNINYAPVCSYDKTATFYSACHAGCSEQGVAGFLNGTASYLNCSCISGAGSSFGSVATDGACVVDCYSNFMIFLACECLIRFLSATGRAGNTLIQFRCVNPEDKSVSIGLTEVLLCVFAFIPGPILYGMILDSSCLVWGVTCGESGNCWLYDGQSLRYLLNLTAAGFMLIGTMLDMGVWYHVKELRIYDEDYAKEAGEDRKPPRKKNKSLEDGRTDEREPLNGGVREEYGEEGRRDDNREEKETVNSVGLIRREEGNVEIERNDLISNGDKTQGTIYPSGLDVSAVMIQEIKSDVKILDGDFGVEKVLKT